MQRELRCQNKYPYHTRTGHTRFEEITFGILILKTIKSNAVSVNHVEYNTAHSTTRDNSKQILVLQSLVPIQYLSMEMNTEIFLKTTY